MTRKLYIKTHGCQMNEYDSSKMADVLVDSHALEVTADPAEADVLISYHVWVETKVRQNDPYFAVYAAEEVEVGTLAVDLSDPESGELIWRGSASHELRVSAVLAGPFDQQLTPTGAERRWRIRESISKIARELRGR